MSSVATGLVMKGLGVSRGTSGTGTSLNNPAGRIGGIQTGFTPPSSSFQTNLNAGGSGAAVSGLRSNSYGDVITLESSGRLGAVYGDAGSISRSNNQPTALGAVYGDSGAVTHAPDRPSGLGATYGDSGAISRPSDRPTGLGATYGDSGAISRPSDRPTGLGATYGDSGAISRPDGRPSGLGATYGDSGAINRGNNHPSGLGATWGDSGAINRTNSPSGLGAVYGDSGAIHRGGINPSGLGATYGDSGAIHRSGQIDTSLGATRGDSGAIHRSGGSSSSLRSGGTSGGLGATRQVGGGSPKTRKRRVMAVRPSRHRDVCCGSRISGKMTLEVHWGFDDKGNELPPEIVRWRAEIEGLDWTPENWEDYMWMDSKSGAPDTETSEIQILNTCEVSLDECSHWALDGPDPHGTRYESQMIPLEFGKVHRITPSVVARGLVPKGMLLWPH